MSWAMVRGQIHRTRQQDRSSRSMHMFKQSSLFVLVIGLTAALVFGPSMFLLPQAGVGLILGTPLELFAPYWSVGGGTESTLIINNTTGRAIEVRPSGFLADGTAVTANSINVPAGASKDVS